MVLVLKLVKLPFKLKLLVPLSTQFPICNWPVEPAVPVNGITSPVNVNWVPLTNILIVPESTLRDMFDQVFKGINMSLL